jgi:hypothetical protein
MAHIEMILLSKIIRTGNLSVVLEWGLAEDDFRTSEGRGMYTHLLGYNKAQESHGSVPGIHSFKHLYPSFDLCDDDSMTMDALCAEVRKRRIAAEAKEAMAEAIDIIDVDPMAAVHQLNERLSFTRALGLKMVDSPLSGAIDQLVHKYEMREKGIVLGSVVQWPWQPFNDVTGGIEDDDFIVVFGRPKSKKSFVIGWMIADAYDQGKSIMVYTKEMPAWQMHQRVAGFIGRLPYNELRLGKLSASEKNILYNVQAMLKEQARATGGRHNVIVISGRDAPAGQDSVSWLQSKVEKYKPDIIFIDGMYLMASANKVRRDDERVKQISRACRQMVLDTKIPLVATIQANRNAAKNSNAELDEIAFSDAIGQDATCIIRVINERGSNPPTCALVVGGSREYELDGVRIWGIPCSNFSFKEKMSEREVEKAKEKDTPDEGPTNTAVKPITRTPVNGKGVMPEKLVKEHLKQL